MSTKQMQIAGGGTFADGNRYDYKVEMEWDMSVSPDGNTTHSEVRVDAPRTYITPSPSEAVRTEILRGAMEEAKRRIAAGSY